MLNAGYSKGVAEARQQFLLSTLHLAHLKISIVRATTKNKQNIYMSIDFTYLFPEELITLWHNKHDRLYENLKKYKSVEN